MCEYGPLLPFGGIALIDELNFHLVEHPPIKERYKPKPRPRPDE